MEVGSFTQIGPSTEVGRKDNVSGDFETFLRMLTTQIQNQDPLSPMEADAFASQLATFSMVEQQTLTNQTLGQLVKALDAGSLSSYASLVGREALHSKPFSFSGEEVRLEFGGGPLSDNVELLIANSKGDVVSNKNMAAGQSQFIWDGLDQSGRTAEPGSYTAELRKNSDGTTLENSIYSSAVIEEIRFGESETELLLSDGTLVSERDVLKLR